MAINGLDSRIKVGTDSILDMNNVSFTINGETYDATTFESDRFRKRVAGLVDATGNISGFYNPSDLTGQNLLKQAALSGTVIESFTYLPDKSDPTSGFTCDVLITSFEVTSQVGGLVGVSIGYESTGLIAPSA